MTDLRRLAPLPFLCRLGLHRWLPWTMVYGHDRRSVRACLRCRRYQERFVR